ncbi:excalibur calcium-binding domain-containing protein [Streptomyces vinaceus]|uniref:excalibur calcium-binding domain-containing protein n=1 Tax=Streptomyces vinaceus TaxID=1960 RepID=UPI00382929A9
MTVPDRTQLSAELEERLEQWRQANRNEQAQWQASQRERQRERLKDELRYGLSACVVVIVLLGLVAWWAVSGISDWLQAPKRNGSVTASIAPSARPAPSWKLDNLTEGYARKDTTLWTDMHESTQLRLLDNEAAEDAHSARRDPLDDDKGLTSADVEITLTREPEHGTLELQADRGIALYTPQPGFGGEDSFDYTIKLRGKPEQRNVKYAVDVGLSPGASYRLEYKYENCDAARAAGAAPLRRGDNGYGRHLDADMDGIACE